MSGYKKGEKILVAMSGGLDSAVTACLLKNQGYHLLGLFLKTEGATPETAQRICSKLDMPCYVVDAQELFLDKVVDYYVHEVLSQRMPSACLACNADVRFPYLLKKADELGCQWVSTGHYAQVVHDQLEGTSRLMKASDAGRDQSYHLYSLSQDVLKRTLMPLGGLPRSMVKKLAEEAGLAGGAESRCSQELCFLRGSDRISFIESRSAPSLRPKGIIRTGEGAMLGEHDGLHKFVVGQSEDIPLNVKDVGPVFVTGFDSPRQALIVGSEAQLMEKELLAVEARWVRKPHGIRGISCKAKVTPQMPEAACMVTLFENDTLRVEFEKPLRAITPGHAVVFYDGDEVIGGALIRRTGNK